MEPVPVTLLESDPLGAALVEMAAARLDHAPVVAPDRRLVGVLYVVDASRGCSIATASPGRATCITSRPLASSKVGSGSGLSVQEGRTPPPPAVSPAPGLR